MPRPLALDGYIAQRAFNQPLLLEEGKAQIISAFLQRRFNMKGTFAEPHMLTPSQKARVEESSLYSSIDHVGIISIVGTLVHRAGDMDADSGLVSYQELRNTIIAAANDAKIKVIVLDIDSGGGEVDGNFELCRLIREVNDTVKPVVAIANGCAYSGAFSIAVSAGQFYMIETGGVGSIGVIVQHIDFSKANEAEGITITNITAGKRKAELSSDFPLSPAAKQMLQDKVDQTYSIFVDHVASMRNISTKAVEGTEGALIFGEESVKLGLIDGIVAYDDLIEALVLADLPVGLTETNMRIENMFLKNKKEAVTAADPKSPEEADKADDKLKYEDEEEIEGEEDDEELPSKPAAETQDPVERAASISELCSANGMSSDAARFIRSSMSMDQIKMEVDRSNEIRNACKLAGKPERADAFIQSGKSLKVVQSELIAEMSDGQNKSDISNKISPEQAQEEVQTGRNWVLEDAERRAAESKKTKAN